MVKVIGSSYSEYDYTRTLSPRVWWKKIKMCRSQAASNRMGGELTLGNATGAPSPYEPHPEERRRSLRTYHHRLSRHRRKGGGGGQNVTTETSSRWYAMSATCVLSPLRALQYRARAACYPESLGISYLFGIFIGWCTSGKAASSSRFEL